MPNEIHGKYIVFSLTFFGLFDQIEPEMKKGRQFSRKSILFRQGHVMAL